MLRLTNNVLSTVQDAISLAKNTKTNVYVTLEILANNRAHPLVLVSFEARKGRRCHCGQLVDIAQMMKQKEGMRR